MPVLVDVGRLGGPAFVAHWQVAFRISAGRVHLAACPWNPRPTISQFLAAWDAWFIPALHYCAVFAVLAAQPAPTGDEDWTHGAFHGSRGTFFVDLTGDGRADPIAVNDDTVSVRRNTGAHDFGPGPQANEDWTHGAFSGTRGTFVADLNADGRPDILAVNNGTVTARRNSGTRFGLMTSVPRLKAAATAFHVCVSAISP